MYSTELIRAFPAYPLEPILYVVYENSYINDAKDLIRIIHGKDYLDKHVTVVPFNKPFKKGDTRYSVYIDPTVFKYKNSWSN